MLAHRHERAYGVLDKLVHRQIRADLDKLDPRSSILGVSK
jgi:hypothetical protein